MDTIFQLCRKYTVLSDPEIEQICRISAFLQLIADLTDADIFIDCPCRARDAIVVAEAKPSAVPSPYQGTVVGMLAKEENEPAVARSLRLGIATKQMKAVTQENSCTIQSVVPIKHEGRVIGVLIQERRTENQPPTEVRTEYGRAAPSAPPGGRPQLGGIQHWLPEEIDEALLIVNKAGVITYRNSPAQKLYQKFGYVEDVLGQPCDNVFFVDPLTVESVSKIEVDVGHHTVNVTRVPLGSNDMEFALIIRDITYRRSQEKELVLKSVAIKEMHHRVKNNLQTIASLLRLQMRRTEGVETRLVLEESMNRILAIASTHQLLSQGGIDTVMLRQVIDDIKTNVLRSFASRDFCVTVRVEGGDFMVESDIATSVALVINELLHNSLKYAFPDGRAATVIIRVARGDLYSRIQVLDDGCGFDVDSIVNHSLGLSIVQTLVKDKLFGAFELESDTSGTRCTFDFRNQIMTIDGAT